VTKKKQISQKYGDCCSSWNIQTEKTITIGLQPVIIVQKAKICLLRQVKNIKFHFVYNFAQPQNSMNNILQPPTQSSTFYLTQNISDAESPVVRTVSLSTPTLRHSL